MKIKDGDFKELVDALFATQEGEFNHIYEQEKIERFKTLCKDKKLIILGTGYYLKVLPKFLKLTYGVDIYGVYDWVAERDSGEGIFANCKDYDYLDLQKYDKYKDKVKFISKEDFYADPANTVVFINSESFLYMPFFLYYNGFKHYYSMRCLGKNLLSQSVLNKKATEFAMYDVNELNHAFTTPEISRIVTLYNLLSDEKSKEVYKAVLKFKLTEDYTYLINVKDDVKKQYFDEVVKFSDEEVFVDCGGYTGDTIEAFLKAVDNKFKHIYSFEPDERNFKILTKYVEGLEQKDKIKAIKAGVYYKSSVFYLQGEEMAIACTNEATDRKVEVCAIDDVVKFAPTYIKMDIETFETYALLGAMDTIINHKPKLAISIYHKFDDLWNIPLLLKQWVSEYDLYIRHYECYQAETVVYAVPRDQK
ncbi:MAG: FkbM family methyltransferase [Campylobacter sp.]|uniref:FkbM family methyltransferase n=1 Tax=Campylobacter sp. TaxID=205 RepID=UPI003616B495